MIAPDAYDWSAIEMFVAARIADFPKTKRKASGKRPRERV